MGRREQDEGAGMIYVIHWAEKRWTGHSIPAGSREADAIRHIMGGHVEGAITRIDRYDTSEHIADDVTDDMACALAREVMDGNYPPTGQVRDFIEERLGVGAAIPAAA